MMTQRKIEPYSLPCLNDAPHETLILTLSEQKALQQKGYQEGYEQGYQIGYEKGKETAILAHEKHQQTTLDNLFQHLEIIRAENQDIRKYAEDTLKHALKLACEKLFPFYLKKEGKEEILRFIHHTLGALLKREDIIVIVHPSMVTFITEKMSQHPELHNKLTITGNPQMTDYACHIQWACGGAIFDMQTMSEKLQCLLGDNSEDCQDPFNYSINQGEDNV